MKIIKPKIDAYILHVVGFEVFTAMTMKNAVFWHVALCVNRRFGGTSSIFRVEKSTSEEPA
jgi:hypothetical protein